ncbi:MAG: DsrE family protein [Acetobacteraceae bacterium]
MKPFATIFAAATIALMASLSSAAADDKAPIFVNLTTEDPHRLSMALTFTANQQERNHPVTVFLNDRGVFIGAKSQAGRFPGQQKKLQDMMANGAQVYICAMCMKHYGVAEADRLEGIKVGDPDSVGAALFRDNGKTLTW